MKYIYWIALCFSASFGQSATANIIGQIGGTSISPTATENFEMFGLDGDAATWVGSAITVQDIGFGGEFYWGPTAEFSTNALYQNGGTHGPIGVSLNSGAAIDAIQFDLSSGWSNNFGNTSTPQYVWVRTLFEGVLTGFEYDLDLPNAPDTVSFVSAGTLFDELQIFSYYAPAIRNSHNFTEVSAAAIDNIVIGTSSSVPSPASLGLLGLGLAGIGWTRHKKANAGKL